MRVILKALAVKPSLGCLMSTQGLEIPAQRSGFLAGSAVLVVIGVLLIALRPVKQS